MIPIWLLKFATSKAGMYTAIAIVAIGLFFAYRMHYISIGKEKGIAEQQQTDQNNIQDNHETGQKAHAAKEAALDAKLETVLKLKTDSDSTLAAAKAMVQTAAQMQQRALEQARAVPSAQVHDYNRSFLNGGKPYAPAACYTVDEERGIQESLVGYSGCRDENVKRSGEAAASDKARAQAEEIARLHKELADERKNRLDQVESDYVLLFNSQKHPQKSWKCARLWKCGNKTITARSVDEARALRAKEMAAQ